MFARWIPQLRILWDLIIATAVATIAVQYRDASGWDVAIGLAMAVAVIFRRFAPTPVFAVVTALALVQLLVASAVPAGYDLAVLVAMTAVVTHARAAVADYLAGGVVAAGVVAAALVRIDGRWNGAIADYPYLAEDALLLAGCGALWLIAFVLRTNRERGAVLAERAATAEREQAQLARLAAADERAFIARELHDVVAHSLAVMIAQADGASYAIDSDAERAREAMRTVAGTGRDALEDMHRIVAVLRGTGSESGTGTGSESGDGGQEADDRRRMGLGQLDTLAERARAAGLDVRLNVTGDRERLSAAHELTVVRIVQESLTNALRHAGPDARVEVTLTVEPRRAVLEISDDGAGKTAPSGGQTRSGGGNGLLGMRERVAVHGGEFAAGPRSDAGGEIAAGPRSEAAGPRPQAGWRVRAMIPLNESAAGGTGRAPATIEEAR